MIAVGLMSGTSLDGIDAALVEIVPAGERYRVTLMRFETYAFDAKLEFALRGALPPNDGGVAVVAALHHALGEAYAAAVRSIAGSTAIDFVASHGQTLWHDGPRNVTLQLGDPFAIREATGVTVCYDFRSGDCAAGGHGAPLVPYVDAMLFGTTDEDRVALNLGGIANVTLLRAGAPWEQTRGFDTGPANMLLDAFVQRRTEERQRFDTGGALAANGRVDDELLEAMLADAYFATAPPKTAGRERFGAHFLDRHGRRLDSLSLEDGAATLTELTASSIAAAVAAAGFERARIIISGGGANNLELLRRIAGRLADARVETSDAMGISPDAKEAVAFALLGYELLRGRSASLPAVTGARHATLLGALAPSDLRSLLAAVERECAMS